MTFKIIDLLIVKMLSLKNLTIKICQFQKMNIHGMTINIIKFVIIQPRW